ncbi:hypothetical protein [Lelliottia amnigena]|uniref:hypothetical protein n=1 Tax=Lelliottia amnigena TaxID=61646 RepID=UPI0040572458
MISGIEPSSEKKGKLVVAFSDDDGASVGVEFASTTQKTATAIMGICASTIGDRTGRLVTSSSSGDTLENSTGGGDNMEKRLAVLEAEVAHIKNDISDIKIEQRTIAANAASASSDIKVVLQKLIDIDTNLSSKAGKDFVESTVSGMKVWLLGILLLSIAMPVISFLLSLYLKKP